MAANFLVPNATLIVELVVFVIVLGILKRFVITPLQAAMWQRRAEIEASLEKARQAEELLVAAEADYQARLRQARQEAKAIIDAGRRVGDYLRQEGRRQGQHDRQLVGVEAARGGDD